MNHQILSLTVSLVVLTAAAQTHAAPLAATGVEVRSSADCPSATAVRAALVGLIPPPNADASETDIADVRLDAGAAMVRLRTSNGAFVAEKRLPKGLSCGERADAVAVILAAWEARLQSGARTSLPLPPDDPPAPGMRAAPAIVPPTPTPPPVPATDLTTVAPGPNPVSSPSWQFSLGAGAFGSFEGSDLRGGATIEATAGRPVSPYAIGVGGFLVGDHQADLGNGQGAWWRMGATVDGRRTFRTDAADLEARVAVALARLEVEGKSFPRTGTDVLVDPGLIGGVRLLPQSQTLRPWLDLGLAYWPRTHALTVSGTDRSIDLPHFELMLGVGLSFGRRG
ncbi:MAG TPA: hypothetical protein VGL59_01555 [Polyangia bacterium]|jgi:hypothetical protein